MLLENTVYTIRLLGRQGLALTNNAAKEESNFHQMLLLRSDDVPEIAQILKRPRNSYTCTETQNELLQLLSMQVQREIASQLKNAEFISIMLDETPDQSNKEQCVFVIRHCDDELHVHEEFIGLYEICDTKADTLV